MKFSHIQTGTCAILAGAFCVKTSSDDELGSAADLFSGPLEVVSEDPRFQWLESPLYSSSGKYLLFSDVKWQNEDGLSCGMLWKFDVATLVLSELLKCSGTAGPPNNSSGGTYPEDMELRIEAGSNGLHWGCNGDGDLLMNQHGWSRIVQLNVDDIDEATSSIDPDKVSIVASQYNASRLNSPNDLVLSEEDGFVYFTDPPFGLQYNNVDDPFGNSFELMTQDAPAVYRVMKGSQPERIIQFDVSEDWSERNGPNGIAQISGTNLFAIVITDFNDPRVEIYEQDADGTLSLEPKAVLHQGYRIQGDNSGFPALSDGITYDSNVGALILSGPGGIYIYETESGSYDLLGFIRIDDLCSNNVIGGGYLWVTCNRRLLRIPLSGYEQVDASNVSSSTKLRCQFAVVLSLIPALLLLVY